MEALPAEPAGSVDLTELPRVPLRFRLLLPRGEGGREGGNSGGDEGGGEGGATGAQAREMREDDDPNSPEP